MSKIIEPIEMVVLDSPDKLRVMTYLHQLKSHFTDTSNNVNNETNDQEIIDNVINDDLPSEKEEEENEMDWIDGREEEDCLDGSVSPDPVPVFKLDRLKSSNWKELRAQKLIESLNQGHDPSDLNTYGTQQVNNPSDTNGKQEEVNSERESSHKEEKSSSSLHEDEKEKKEEGGKEDQDQREEARKSAQRSSRIFDSVSTTKRGKNLILLLPYRSSLSLSSLPQ